LPAYAKTYFLILSLPLPLAAVSALAFAILISQVTAQQSVDAQQQSSQTFTAELTGKNEYRP
jgi:hypothetical protein